MRTGSIWLAAAMTVGGLAFAPFARADADQAKKYVDEAKHQLEMNSFDDAKAKIELAEAELDGVDDAAKAPIVASIAQMKQQIAANAAAGDKAKYLSKLQRAMDDAESGVGNLATWPGAEAEVKEVFDDADAKAAIPDELAAAQKKFATLKKVNDKKAGAARAAESETAVAELETTWAADKPKLTTDDKSVAINEMGTELEAARRSLSNLDADAAKPFAARIDKVGAEFADLALADTIKEKTARLQESWDSYKDEWTGWQNETSGPSFAEFSARQSDEMGRLNAPKSVALISRANGFAKDLKSDDDYQKVASAPSVKAIVDKIAADEQAAMKKVEGFADRIMGEAEKAKLDANGLDSFKRFQDGLASNLEGSDKLEALQARAKALIDKYENAGKANDEATAAFYKDATAKAAADWPAMKAKFNTEEGFDPTQPAAFKGKYILITTDNLMGYKFMPGDFKFATTLDGSPIAGKYDPAVAKAIKDVQAKLGRDLGDDDNDGKWEVVALVTGSVGKLTTRENVEGKIHDDAGNTATITGEKHETVDAPIVTIVAAHCGPMAAAK